MAVDLIATDAMFPDYRPGMDTDAYLRENNNYLFLLKESLNYTLHNLGVANFNARQFQTISDIITKPIMMALVGDEGQLTSIQADLEGIKTTVGTVEGNVTTIQQTVEKISADVKGIDGKYSSLSQTVTGVNITVGTINDNYISKSSATQSASDFKFEVMDSNHSNALVTLDSSGLTIKGGGILAKLGALLLMPTLKKLGKRLDVTEYGGAPLLGVNGCCIISHRFTEALSILAQKKI